MKYKKAKLCVILFLVIVFILSSGCSIQTTRSINMVDLKQTNFSKIMKKGESCGTWFLGFIGPFGNPSLVEAAKNGNITTIDAVDEYSSYYILFSQRCKIAYGH